MQIQTNRRKYTQKHTQVDMIYSLIYRDTHRDLPKTQAYIEMRRHIHMYTKDIDTITNPNIHSRLYRHMLSHIDLHKETQKNIYKDTRKHHIDLHKDTQSHKQTHHIDLYKDTQRHKQTHHIDYTKTQRDTSRRNACMHSRIPTHTQTHYYR